MAGWVIGSVLVLLLLAVGWKAIAVLAEIVKLARDIFDHMHVKHLAELAVGMQITTIANGEEREGCSFERAVAAAAHKMNDALMSNGYDVGKWNAGAMVRAVVGQRDNLVKLRAVVAAVCEIEK